MNAVYRWSFTFLMILCPTLGHGQGISVAIQNLRTGSVYAKVNNQLAIAVEGLSGKYLVETDNGTIEKDPDSRDYSWRPEHSGPSVLVLRKAKSPHDTLWKELYKVADLPAPIPFFAGKKGGALKYSTARIQIAPVAERFTGVFGDIVYHIVEFTIIVNRDGKEIYRKTLANSRGTRFSNDESSEKIISTLQPNDLLIFNDIKARGPGGEMYDLSSMVFTITD